MEPLFSLCDKKNVRKAEANTTCPKCCMNAFTSADRKIIYVSLGTETNQARQILFGVDRKSLAVDRSVRTFTVARGYCLQDYKDCVFLIPSQNLIRLWDEEKRQAISDFPFEDRKAVLLTPDREQPLVYAAFEDGRIAVVDMAEKKIKELIDIPSSSISSITNTNKKIVTASSLFFHNNIIALDKKSKTIERIPVGRSKLHKNLGYFTCAEADPLRERVFIAAPLESAVYMIDLETKRTVWRLPLAPGVKSLAFDPRTGVLHAADFLNGFIYKIDTLGEKPRVIGRAFAGRRLRYLYYEPELNAMLSVSANGFYIYNPGLGAKLWAPGGRLNGVGKTVPPLVKTEIASSSQYIEARPGAASISIESLTPVSTPSPAIQKKIRRRMSGKRTTIIKKQEAEIKIDKISNPAPDAPTPENTLLPPL